MIDIKIAAPAVIAGVAAAGVSVKKIIARTKTKRLVAELKRDVEYIELVQANAHNKAQRMISDRMLSGYYDDKTDAEARHDFVILYANFLKN